MPRYDLPRAADGPLRLVQLFVNTVDHEHGREWWPTPDALQDWLAEHDSMGLRPTASDLERALRLREALRTLLLANNVGGDTREAAEIVNRAASGAGLGVAVDEHGEVRLEVRNGGFDGAIGRVVAVAFDAMLDGSWGRLKACRQCGWVFYDTSKNRSGSWCSMQLCGNRTKTRAYRRRKSGGGRP